MINKRISKITMLTALFIGGIVNAQEFYTCVPKKNTIMNININNVDELAKAIIKVGGGNSNLNQKKWELIKSVNLNNYDNSIKLEPGQYKFILKNNQTTIQNVADSKVTAELKLIKYKSERCEQQEEKDRLVNFFAEYDKRNLYYLAKVDFREKCLLKDTAGISALVLGNIALFAYECTCYHPKDIFRYSTLEVYKKDDD